MTSAGRSRTVVTLATVAGASVLLGAQDPARTGSQTPAIPTFRSSVHAVQITAIVTDADGGPVAGLTADDFELLENGQPQPITTFSAVEIPVERAVQVRVQRDVLGNVGGPGRTYVIAVDDVRLEEAKLARVFLEQFIEQYFGPNDAAAVVATTSPAPDDAGHDFTSNPQLLLAAFDRLTAAPSPDLGPLARGSREKYLMKGLRKLTEMLAKVPGRKALVFVSAKGLGDVDPKEACGCNALKLVDYKPGPLGGLFFDMNHDFHNALSAATRGNVVFYPISPSGATRDPGLEALAKVTGGFAMNINDPKAGFERLVREHSTYYVIGFNSTDGSKDGRFVNLELRVTRPGLSVRSLDGYIAPRTTPEVERRPQALFAAAWDAVASPLTTSGIPMRVHAVPFRGEGKNATVAVTLEIAATKLDLVEKDGAYRGELEILLAVTNAKGKALPLQRHRAALALKADTYERMSRSALRVQTQVVLPNGRYQLRVSAGDAVVAGSVVYDLVVPDFGRDLSMSGIAVTSEQARRMLTVSSPHVRLDAMLPWPATTEREFQREDAVMLFTRVYENRRKPHVVTFRLELRDSAGGVVLTRVEARNISDRPKRATIHTFAPTLELEDVAPGDYSVYVEASSSLDQGSSLSREIPISVR